VHCCVTSSGRRCGGRGSRAAAPTWRKQNALGDWAVVNVQSSSWSSAEQVRCIVNLALAPAPWLAWTAYHRAHDAALQSYATSSRNVNEYHGLFRVREEPSSNLAGDREAWWQVTDDATAQETALDIVRQLEVAGARVGERPEPLRGRALEPADLDPGGRAPDVPPNRELRTSAQVRVAAEAAATAALTQVSWWWPRTRRWPEMFSLPRWGPPPRASCSGSFGGNARGPQGPCEPASCGRYPCSRSASARERSGIKPPGPHLSVGVGSQVAFRAGFLGSWLSYTYEIVQYLPRGGW
jgi:Domain of unknown function (DUF4304)